MAKLTLPAQELMHRGHAACPGCGPALAMRLLLKGLGPRTVLSIPACCWTVIATPFPTTALGVPVLDNPIEATGASISGLRAAADALGLEDVTVVGFAGDGGTADIGLQALSGMLERRTNAVFVMYDNEGYMNTGVQRSGATPRGAWTTTTPIEGEHGGKAEEKKDIMGIVLAHRPTYAATVNPAFPEDFVRKAEFSSEETIDIGRLATETGLFPLYEVENGVYRITRKAGALKPVDEYVRGQSRFRHWTDVDIGRLNEQVRAGWERLLRLERETAPNLPGAPAALPKAPVAA